MDIWTGGEIWNEKDLRHFSQLMGDARVAEWSDSGAFSLHLSSRFSLCDLRFAICDLRFAVENCSNSSAAAGAGSLSLLALSGFENDWFKFIGIWLKVVASLKLIVIAHWIGKLWMKFLFTKALCQLQLSNIFFCSFLKLPLANPMKILEQLVNNCTMWKKEKPWSKKAWICRRRPSKPGSWPDFIEFQCFSSNRSK